MKWITFLLVIAVIGVVLWKYGFVEKFLGPWAAWSRWIGYFQ